MISNDSILNFTTDIFSTLTTEVFCDNTYTLIQSNTILDTHINTVYLVLSASIIFIAARVLFKYNYISEKTIIDINRYADIVYFGSAFFLWSHIVMLQVLGVI